MKLMALTVSPMTSRPNHPGRLSGNKFSDYRKQQTARPLDTPFCFPVVCAKEACYSGCEAAVNVQDCAGYEASTWTGQIKDGRGDLVQGCEALNGVTFHDDGRQVIF